MNDVQVGITSFLDSYHSYQPIDNCINEGDVFTRVSAYADWIKENMALGQLDNEDTNKTPIFWWPF